MASERVEINSKGGLPVGRIVAGSLYKPNTTDFDGKPLVVKTGPNAGQPRVQYYIALAIPKAGERHWAETIWGSKIWAEGHRAFPAAAQRPDFHWKIIDGDSQVPGKGNPPRRPCDQEGYPGNWILKLSGGFAPKVYEIVNGGYVEQLTENYVKPGYYIETSFNVAGNDNQQNPGVYLNLSMVCFRAFGQEITFGPDVSEAGFGSAALPAGASMTPPASQAPPPAAPGAYQPPAPGGYAPPAPPAAPQAAPVPVYPNPGFVQMPSPGAYQPPAPGAYAPPNPYQAANGPGATSPAAGAIPPPPVNVSPSKQMTAKAQGASFESYIAAGWTEGQLIQHGIMMA